MHRPVHVHRLGAGASAGTDSRRRIGCSGFGSGFYGGAATSGLSGSATEENHHGDGAGSVLGEGEGGLNIDGDLRIGGVIDVTYKLFGDGIDIAILALSGVGYLPLDLGDVPGHAAVDFAIEILHDFGAALIPPLLGAGDLLAVFESQGVGIIGIGIGLRLVIIGVIGGLFVVAVGSAAEGGEMELIHHILMVRGSVGCCGEGGLAAGGAAGAVAGGD